MQSSLSSLTAFAISLPFSLFRFKRSNFPIPRSSALLTFFFLFTSPFHSTRYIHVVPRCLLHANTFIFLVTLFTNENSLLFRPPYIVPPSIIIPSHPPPPRDGASPVFSSTFRRSRYTRVKKKGHRKAVGEELKKYSPHTPIPSPSSLPSPRLTLSKRFSGRRAKGKRARRQRAGRLAIAICGMDPRGWGTDREERITGRTGRCGATGGARLGGQVWEEKDGGGGGGKWRRKGRGRMQRIRKERSPAPAYVMPSGHCQPAPAPPPLPLLSREGAKGVDGAKGQSCPRNRSRENSDRSQGLISIFGRSFACSLFEHPDDENSDDDDARHRRREQYSPQSRPFLFTRPFTVQGVGARHRCPWQ